MKKKKIRFLVTLIMIFCLIYPSQSVGVTASTSKSTVQELENKLSQAESAREAAQKAVDKANEDKADAMTQKEALDKKVNSLHSEMATLEELISGYEIQIEQYNAQISLEEKSFADRYDILKKRIRVNRENGGINALALILESGSFTEALTEVDRFYSLVDYDNKLMSECTNSIIILKGLKTDCETAKAQLEASKAVLVAREAELKADLNTVESLIKTAEKDIETNKAKIEELEALEQKYNSEREQRLKQISSSTTTQNTYVGGDFIWPLENYHEVSCGFGPRTHPVTGVPQHHNGIDIPAPYGTPIRAVNAGTVVEVSSNGADGYYVTVNHGGGIASFYSHISSSAVSVGDTVKKGQVIAYVGMSGWVTGAHLNLNMYKNNVAVDPNNFSGLQYTVDSKYL